MCFNPVNPLPPFRPISSCRGWYTRKTRNSIRAYALYVRMQFGEDVGDAADALFQAEAYPDDLAIEAMGWLVSCMGGAVNDRSHAKSINKIFRVLRSRITETAETGMSSAGRRNSGKGGVDVSFGRMSKVRELIPHSCDFFLLPLPFGGAANFVTSYGDDGSLVMLHSNRRTDAILLDAWLACFPDDPIISKLAKGLLAHKKKGRWGSTQVYVCVCVCVCVCARARVWGGGRLHVHLLERYGRHFVGYSHQPPTTPFPL